MKHLVYLFLFISFLAHGQLYFDFERGELDAWIQFPAGHWETDSLASIDGNFSLHHGFDNSASGCDYISRNILYPDLDDTIRISFKIRHGYNPSSGNNWQLLLFANDSANIEPGNTSLSCFVLGVNFIDSDDHIKLYQLINGTVNEICNSSINYQEDVGSDGILYFRLSRIPGGKWILETQNLEPDNSFVEVGDGNEIQAVEAKYFGFRYTYSPAQDRKLWIDNLLIEGNFFNDTLPPKFSHSKLIGLNGIQMVFNEKVSLSRDINIAWNETAPETIAISGNIVDLYFAELFPNRVSQKILISGIEDLEGNRLADTILNFYQDLPEFGDLIINELMPDPEPEVYLPNCEYLELFNRYKDTVFMENWKLSIYGREYTIPNFQIPAEDYIVLISETCPLFVEEVETLNAFSSNSVFSNNEGTISLLDQYNRLIHRFDYNHLEDYDNSKSGGGWSLECNDPDNICGGAANLSFSSDYRGGSPGKINSNIVRIADNEGPILAYLGIPTEKDIILNYNEIVFSPQSSNAILELNGKALICESILNEQVSSIIRLSAENPISHSGSHELRIAGIRDCAGNISTEIRSKISLPSLPFSEGILINELMFDPAPGSQEYIEIYNCSDEFFDLSDLKLKLGESDSQTGKAISLGKSSHILFPGKLVVICKNSQMLRKEWDLDWSIDVLELGDWKSLPNEEGCIFLTDKSETILDIVCYNNSLHHEFIRITSGVALERINHAPCKEPSLCWTSAASAANYGTPGSYNSQAIESEDNSDYDFKIYPEVFSPDMDGHDDIIEISCPGEFQNSLVDIVITDMNGRIVKHLVSKGILGSSDTYYWDGEDKEGYLVLPGIYIIHIGVIMESATKYFRKACALKYR
jgi:hypothetical protein